MNQRYTLLAFMALAALIGVLEWRAPKDANPKTVVITQAQRTFVQEQISQPSAASPSIQSFDQAMKTWTDEEILYREGVALGLDKNDLIVKRRVVQKMRFLLEDMTPLPPPTQEQMDTWLKQHPEMYQTDQRLRFEHVFFSRGKRGDGALQDARSIRAQLIRGAQTPAGDPFPLDAVQNAVSLERLEKEVGSTTAKRVQELPLNAWSDPLNSAVGVHLFRVLEKTPGRTMTLQEAGEGLKADLLAAQRKTVNEASMAALRSTYRVEEKP